MCKKETNQDHHELLSSKTVTEQLIAELANRGLSIAFAEGCTGGALADALTIPGSTQVFHVGCVAYSKQAKIDLGVAPSLIDQYGEYSSQVALEMAKAIQKLRGDTIGISTVGRLDSNSKQGIPVVHIGYAIGDKAFVDTIQLPLKPRRDLKEYIAQIGFLEILTLLRHGNNNSRLPTVRRENDLTLQHTPQNSVCDVIAHLNKECLNIVSVESCTGGAVANALTDIKGASTFFDRGWVLYDENAKTMLGVPLLALAQGGVYSELVAFQMALAGFEKSNADIVVATTGVMDTIDTRPYHNGTSPGTIYIAILARGMRPITYTLIIPVQLRQKMKQEIVSSIMIRLSKLIAAHEDNRLDVLQQEFGH